MRVFYVDDEQLALTDFVSQHAREGITVESCRDARKVIEILSTRGKRDRPDIIIMDLYATMDGFDSDAAVDTNRQVDILVEKIAHARNELREVVHKAKVPVSLSVLRDLRQCSSLKRIPVILRTREGLALLEDNALTESLRLGAMWMLKGRAPETERAMMNRAWEDAKSARRRIRRDVFLMLSGSILGALLGVLLSLSWT